MRGTISKYIKDEMNPWVGALYRMHHVPEILVMTEKGTGKSHAMAQIAYKFIEYPWWHVLMFRQRIGELTAPGGAFEIALRYAMHPDNRADFVIDRLNHVIMHKNGGTIRAGALDAKSGWTHYAGNRITLLEYDEVTRIALHAIQETNASARLTVDCPLDDVWILYFGNPDWGETYDWLMDEIVNPCRKDGNNSERMFVQVKMEDNKFLKDPAKYRARLYRQFEPWRAKQLGDGSVDEVPGATAINVDKILMVEREDPRALDIRASARAWDWAKTQGRGDYTSGGRLDRLANRYIIRPMVRGRWDKTNVEIQMALTAHGDGYGVPIGIESAYHSDMWINSLRNGVLYGYDVRELDSRIVGRQNPDTKVARATAMIAAINHGEFMMEIDEQGGDGWNAVLKREMRAFGVEKGGHDDQIDSLAYAYNMLNSGGAALLTDWDEDDEWD